MSVPSSAADAVPGRVRLRFVLALTAGLPVVLAVGLTGWLSLRNGEHAVRGLVEDLQLEVASGAEAGLRHTLEPPHLLNALNGDLLRNEVIEARDLDGLQHHLYRELRHFDTAGYVQIGRADGHFVGVERTATGFRVERTDPALTGKDVWELDSSGGRVGAPVAHVANYKATERPWYKAAIAANKATWSPIYQFSSRDQARLGITAVEPWFNRDGAIGGVVGTDIVLAQLGEQLRSPRLRTGGRVFVLERSGMLVAHSHMAAPFSVAADKTAQRLTGALSDDPLTRAATAVLSERLGGLRSIQGTVRRTFPFDGDVAFLSAVPLTDGRGLDWLLVTALPRADFTPEIRANARATALLCAVGLGVALALGLVVSRRVGQPILDLADAALAISERRSDAPLPTTRTAEIAILADAFQRMRDDLQVQQEALELTAADALEAQALAEAASRAKSAFLANMSHELRTPLNAILGYAALLAEDPAASPESATDLERIQTAGNHLLALISDVLDLSRIEAGYLDLAVVPSDAVQIAREAASLTQPLIEAAGNQLVLDLPGAALPLTTDPDKLRQCLVNLLGNAAKFTRDGTITLSLRTLEGDLVGFAVRDTGIGIASDQLPLLFAPFSQVDTSATRERDGAGLGLAISREYVHALGGEITVASEVGVGSVFRIRVPVAGPRPRSAPPSERR